MRLTARGRAVVVVLFALTGAGLGYASAAMNVWWY